MTVFESLKNKSIDELAEWLDENCEYDTAPWASFWDIRYCNKCEPIESKVPNQFGYDMECSYCELYSRCKFFKELDDIPDNKQIIKMWLESESN